MLILPPVIDLDARIDFYAGDTKAYQLLKPIYLSLKDDRRGIFYTSASLPVDIQATRMPRNKLDGFNPLVIASYRDLNIVFYLGEERPFIFLESEYTQDSRGLLNAIALFLCIDERSYNFRTRFKRTAEKINCPEEAALKIEQFIKGKEVKHITEVNHHSVGLIYMAFGKKAFDGVKKSVYSLKRLGFSYPISVVGDFNNLSNIPKSFQCLQWRGETPFDLTQRRNFQYRAGRIKPYLYQYSPFEYTLYLDADTLFVKDIREGFELLGKYDLAVTEEKLTLQQLYNKKLAGWEINLLERDTTIIEIGGDASQKFINSGVFFFKRNKKTDNLFEQWGQEWKRFQEWDEQLALMRSIHRNPKVKVKKLPVEWNDPFPNSNSYIFHNYGRGEVRTNL